MSYYTIHGHACAIRALTRWAYDQHYLAEDSFAHLPVPKVPQLEKQILTEEEITRIFECINPTTTDGKRLRTMITLLLETGIRASECLSLKIEDVHIDEGSIKVFGKGRKERSVAIGLTVQKELMTYIDFYRPKPARPDIQNVFLTDEGFPLTLSGLGSIFERLKKRSGISRLHAHLLRHTALTMMIEREVPAFVVQGWAGHTSVQTTQIYVHLAQRRTNLKYQKNSVVDGLQILKHRPSRRPSARRKQGPLSSS